MQISVPDLIYLIEGSAFRELVYHRPTTHREYLGQTYWNEPFMWRTPFRFRVEAFYFELSQIFNKHIFYLYKMIYNVGNFLFMPIIKRSGLSSNMIF